MKRGILLAFLYCLTTSISGIDLPDDKLKRVFESTYEVVIEKPTEDTVVYERELPLHLLPYQYRTDKYYSVGSAFQGEDGLFITASHVLKIGGESQNKKIGIRDSSGKVYPIDTIYKYSSNRDFVVFSVKDHVKGQGLAFARKSTINKKIYAVGNALGEGVVIRDGLYTSDTPEEVAGEWKWMRFSAAASPGNSGGPLLDQKGDVVGIILRKSESENLNYALPISEIEKFMPKAEFKTTAIYRLDLTNDSLEFKFNIEHDLPMGINELDDFLQKEIFKTTKKASEDYLAKFSPEMFPNGNGSLPMLYNHYVSFFPAIMARGKDGLWDFYTPKDVEGADTENGGRIDYGSMGNFYYIKVKMPRNANSDEYYADSKGFMDQILKGLPYRRQINVETIRINSIGKAAEERWFTDSYGRKWQVRKWNVGFEDKSFVTYALPTPDGYAVILSYSDTGAARYQEIDMQIIVNDLYFTYYGTLEQWKYFLSRKDLLPEFAKGIKVESDYENYISYSDSNFDFKVTKDTMKITKESDLQVRCSYVKVGDKVIWEPFSIGVGENKDSRDVVAVTQSIKPPDNLADEYTKNWKKVSEKIHPYNGQSYYEDQMTHLSVVVDKKGNTPINKNAIYVVTWHQIGNIESDKMEAKLKSFTSNLKIK